MKAFHIAQTEDYRLREEAEQADATIFIIGAVPEWEMITLRGRLAQVRGAGEGRSDAEFAQDFGPIIPDILRAGLRGWRNFRNADGSEVRFATGNDGKPMNTTLAQLGPAVTELALEVIKFNTVRADELGN